MKKIILIIFFIIYILSFANVDIKDYEIFLKGREEFEKENYINADKFFTEIMIAYPDSNLIKSKYINYYIGITKYELKNFEEAVSYLEKSTYNNYEKNYILGKIFDYSDKELAKNYFLKLYSDKYRNDNEKYEKLALENLIGYDNYFEEIYIAKFSNQKADLSKIKMEDLIKIGDYFFSFGNYKTAERYYEEIIRKEKNDDVELKLLKTYYYQKEYEKAYLYGEKILDKNENISKINYYTGISYKRKELYSKAIEKFKNIKEGKMLNLANLEIGKIYYVLNDNEKALEVFEKLNSNESKEYIIKIFEKNSDEEKYVNAVIDYIKTDPYSETAAYYRFMMYEKEKQTTYLEWILYYNMDSYYYEQASNILKKEGTITKYNLEKRYKEYDSLVEKLERLSELKFYEACKLEIEYSKINKEDDVFKTYLLTKYYEKSEKYYMAIKNSYYNPYKIAKYENLRKDLYPIYYTEYVEKYSKEFNVDKYLIYSVIKQESMFNSDDISRASAYGLMQVLVPTARMFDKSMTGKKLLIPEENIKIGVQYLSYLLKRFDNDLNQVIASYNAGPGNVSKWLEKDGKIEIEKIPFPETKTYVKKVLNNYYKYKKLYETAQNL